MSEFPTDVRMVADGIAADIPSTVRKGNRPFISNVIARAIMADRTALSSAAVAEREPVAFVSAMAIRYHIDSGTSQTGTVLHREQGELYGEKHLALYLDPPPVSELEAENARLRKGLLESNARAEGQWVGWVKEEAFRKAAEARLAEALKALDVVFEDTQARTKAGMTYGINGHPTLSPATLHVVAQARFAARRVREGGNVDG